MLKLGTYQHYKGGLYEVLGVGINSDSEEEMVVYRALYGNHQLWVRSLKVFLEEVSVDGAYQPRFVFIKE